MECRLGSGGRGVGLLGYNPPSDAAEVIFIWGGDFYG